MVIRHVKIRRFRGINELSWTVGGKMVCLVGPGDSTKTTILDAIELALAPRWPIQFSDVDFYLRECKLDNPIEIEVTVGELPEELLTQDKFGLLQRGWHRKDNRLKDDPLDDCEGVLTIKLTVDDSLEPEWNVIKPSNNDTRKIGWRERQKLGVIRLGTRAEQHLSWGRTSALSRLTSGPLRPGPALAPVQREAQQAFDKVELPKLVDAAGKAKRLAETYGLETAGEYHPGLDPGSLILGQGALTLYDGKIPLRAKGLGSRRLTAIALQQSCVEQGAIVLVDEVEYGLDPHRIRRLLRNLRGSAHSSGQDETSVVGVRPGQVLVTSHSPVAVRELSPEELRVTRSHEGVTEIIAPTSDLAHAMLRDPEAIMARKIVVCEGMTEVGFYVSLGEVWAKKSARIPLACYGVVPIDGHGNTTGPEVARNIKEICDNVMYFGDSDKPPKPSEQTLAKAGVAVVLWPNGLSTEECVGRNLPWKGLVDFIKYVSSETSAGHVIDMIKKVGPEDCDKLSDDVDAWPNAGVRRHVVGQALGAAAKKHKWCKSYEAGQKLGEIVGHNLADIDQSDLFKTIEKLEKWAYKER